MYFSMDDLNRVEMQTNKQNNQINETDPELKTAGFTLKINK